MMVNLMKQELQRDEALRLRPYQDTLGKLTIGVGRNLSDVGITFEEADYLLTNDIANAMHALDTVIPTWKLFSENRQRALVNMMFNLGMHKFLEFKNMISYLKAGDFEKAAASALDSEWSKQVGSRANRIAAQIENG